MRLYFYIRNLFIGTPRYLLMYAIAALTLLASCGTLTFWMPGNTFGFFNPCTWIFAVFALPPLLTSLGKYAAGSGKRLKAYLPPGAVLLMAEHTLSVQQRDRLLTGVRETITTRQVQPQIFQPPPIGEQMVSVTCQVCQQQMLFRVDSLQRRKQRRIQVAGIAIACCVLAAIIEYVIGLFVPADPHASWIFYVSLLAALLVFCAGLCVAYLINYGGVVRKKAPAGHSWRWPTPAEIDQLVQSYQARGVAR